MFEFFFKYPPTVFAKGDLVFLTRWPLWVLAAAILATAALLGWILWRRRTALAPGILRVASSGHLAAADGPGSVAPLDAVASGHQRGHA